MSISTDSTICLVFGQVIFGYLADVLGRKKMYGVELMIIICTTLAQSLCGESTAVSVVGVLIFCKSKSRLECRTVPYSRFCAEFYQTVLSWQVPLGASNPNRRSYIAGDRRRRRLSS